MAVSTGALAAAGTYTVQQGSSTSLATNTLQLDCNTLDVLGNFGVGNGTVGSSGNVAISGTGNLNGGSGVINAGGNWSNAGTFVAGSGTVNLSGNCASGPSDGHAGGRAPSLLGGNWRKWPA